METYKIFKLIIELKDGERTVRADPKEYTFVKAKSLLDARRVVASSWNVPIGLILGIEVTNAPYQEVAKKVDKIGLPWYRRINPSPSD